MPARCETPPPIAKFLSTSRSGIFLVRGEAGSGRTLFALSLLQAFGTAGSYVSPHLTRRQASGMAKPYWQSALPLTVFGLEDLSHLPGPPDGSPPDPPGELPPWIDAWLRSGDGQKPAAIVVDTWEAFLQTVGRWWRGERSDAGRDSLASRFIEVFAQHVGQRSFRAVILLEGSSGGPLDHIADAIFTLTKPSLEERQYRWLSIDELRRVDVQVREYPFTLAGGSFECFPPSELSELPPAARADPAPPGDFGTSLWPGSADYHNIFGSFHGNFMTLLEVDDEIPSGAVQAISNTAMLAALRMGRRVGYVPRPHVRLEGIWASFAPVVKPEVFSSLVRVLSLAPLEEPREPLRTVHLSPEFPSEEEDTRTFQIRGAVRPPGAGSSYQVREAYRARSSALFDFLRGPAEAHPPNLMIGTLGGIENIGRSVSREYTPETLAYVLQSYLAAGPLHTLVIGSRNNPLVTYFRDLSQTRLLMRAVKGRFFLMGIRPWTPIYALTMPAGEEPEQASYRLTLMS